MDKGFIQNDMENGVYGENCMNKCPLLNEYLEMYKDPDEAEERLAIERCEQCVLNQS